MIVKMDNVNLKKVNTKSESGFTFTDLAIAIFIIMLFTGTIGTIMYQITEVKIKYTTFCWSNCLCYTNIRRYR